ncbi:MAG: type I-E CRISPR-associated protein Cas7/Cse4/CasC, partial [Enterococcus faecalis]|nr:type I-E CRISPR-associated protein Cas7/Cse4/CasC [Enterococcus faecalis]
NLVSAFEEPVKSIEGYVTKSIDKLAKEFTKVEKFVDKPLMTFYVTLHESDNLKQIGEEKDSISKLLEDFSEMIAQYI